MSEIRQTDQNDLDRIYDIYKLGDLFAAVYRDSDYRFGELHFREAMGVGVVVTQPIAAGSHPDHIPEPAIIDREALPRFATHIDALFEHYTMPAAQPVADWGERLVAELTARNGPIGGFVGEQNLIEAYDGWGCELDGLVEPAKMRESAASADRSGY